VLAGASDASPNIGGGAVNPTWRAAETRGCRV
jgi:hypothetical protein